MKLTTDEPVLDTGAVDELCEVFIARFSVVWRGGGRLKRVLEFESVRVRWLE